MNPPRELKNPTRLHPHVEHQPGTPILQIEDLCVSYDGLPALEGVSLKVDTGERIAVVGPNGAGKSTLFKVIAGVLPASSGEVKIAGYGPGGHICIAYLPQRSQVDWNFPVNVSDVVMMGRAGRLGLFHWPKRSDWDYVRQCLQVVAMSHLAQRQINELSGGQQQRMFIARALAQEAELMLMDEPFTGLDMRSQEDILNILGELKQRGVTVLASTHDLNLAGEHFDRVVLLNRRLLGFGLPEQVFTPERLLLAYAGHLRMVQTGDTTLALGDTCCEDEGDHAHA
jgi:ABC-type Mn2+/Zn2+ transport system ATPase subunit